MSSTAVETKANPDGTVIERGRYGRYFDPVAESDVMKKIVAEMVAFNPAKTAVMLQLALPGVGKGVHNHSSFTLRPVERSRRSLVYIYAMTFGTLAERRKVSDATHRAHTRVHGADYDANDVDLQLWVAATIYWSIILGYEDVYGKLDEATADKAYKEFSVMATGLRVPPEMWPADRKAFDEYWNKMIGSLHVTPEAKAVSKDLLWPEKNMPWGFWLLAKAIGPSQRSNTIEYLPARVRNEYGYPSTIFTRFMYLFRRTLERNLLPWMPLYIRHYAKNFYMADFRDRLAKGMRI